MTPSHTIKDTCILSMLYKSGTGELEVKKFVFEEHFIGEASNTKLPSLSIEFEISYKYIKMLEWLEFYSWENPI